MQVIQQIYFLHRVQTGHHQELERFSEHIIFLFSGCMTATVSPKPETLDLSSNFLPKSFPKGVDPSQYALPVFLEKPKDTYAARGASATLTCRAAHALKAYFSCNGEVREDSPDPELAGDLEDPQTGMKYKKISIEVSRADVMDVLGKFSCKCHASSAQGEVESEEAVVKQACKFPISHQQYTAAARSN